MTLTLQNFGTSDVDGLNLTLKNDAGVYLCMPVSIGLIHAGEEKNVRINLETNLFSWSDTFFATLMFDSLILNEYVYDRDW